MAGGYVSHGIAGSAVGPLKRGFTALAVLMSAMLTIGAAAAPTVLAGTSWRLQDLDGGMAIQSGPGGFLLGFGPKDELWGRDGCNGFWGRYTVQGREIHIELEGMTSAACQVAADPLNHARGLALKSLLNHAETYEVQNGVLYLSGDGQSGAFSAEGGGRR